MLKCTHSWKSFPVHGTLAAQGHCRGGFYSAFHAFIRLLYFLFYGFMDTSGIPGLCLLSENLTRIEDNISILCSHQAGGLLTDPPSVKAVPANLGQPGAGHLPGPTRSTGRQREKGSENKKMTGPEPSWSSSKCCPECPGSCSALFPAWAQGFPQVLLPTLTMFRRGW